MPDDLSPLSALFQLPPEKAIAFLESKGYRLTWNWWEMHGEAHARDFTVAKVARLDILEDIRAAVQTALKEGRTERWFIKDLQAVLRRKGWWGKQVDVDPVTGEARLYQAGSVRRLQTIYRTNLQVAYMAGRQRQFDEEIERAPYVQYLAVLDSMTRPAHAALHGKVFRLDDPVWDVIAPPNGFGCRCRARNLSERELRTRGLTVENDVRPEERDAPGNPPVDPRTGETPASWKQRGISIPDPTRPGERQYFWPDTGWDYNPGRSGLDWLQEMVARKEATLGVSAGTEPPRVFEPQRTAAAAARYAVRAGLADAADYKGIKPDVANAWNASLFEHVTRFPQLRAQQQFVGSAQAQCARWRENETQRVLGLLRKANPGVAEERLLEQARRIVKPLRMQGKVYAQSWRQDGVSGVAINHRWGKDAAALQDALAQDVRANWHPVGCDGIKSIVDHEFGHQLDELLELARDPEVIALWQQGKASIASGLSRYAATSIREMIAEAWAEYLNNPQPRTLAQTIGEIIERRYRDRHSGDRD